MESVARPDSRAGVNRVAFDSRSPSHRPLGDHVSVAQHKLIRRTRADRPTHRAVRGFQGVDTPVVAGDNNGLFPNRRSAADRTIGLEPPLDLARLEIDSVQHALDVIAEVNPPACNHRLEHVVVAYASIAGPRGRRGMGRLKRPGRLQLAGDSFAGVSASLSVGVIRRPIGSRRCRNRHRTQHHRHRYSSQHSLSPVGLVARYDHPGFADHFFLAGWRATVAVLR